MNKKLPLLFTFISLLIIPSLMFPFLESSFAKVDEDENRNLAPFPTEIKDNVGTEFSSFISDHFPFRKEIIASYNAMNNFLSDFYLSFTSKPKPIIPDIDEKEDEDEDIIVEEGDYQGEEETFDPIEEDNSLTYKQIGNVIFGKNDFLFYTGDDELLDYTKTNIPNEKELIRCKNKLEKVSTYFNSLGKKVIFMVCPNKSTTYSEYMPSAINRVNTPKNKSQVLVDYLSSNIDNVTSLYPLDELLSVKKTRTLYYKSDTHWNNIGAFVGFRALMDKAFDQHYYIPYLLKYYKEAGDLAKLSSTNHTDDLDYYLGFKNELEIVKDEIKDEKGYTVYEYNCSEAEFGKGFFIHDSFSYGMMDPFSKVFKESTFVNFNSKFEDYFESERFKNSDYIIIETVERSLTRMFKDGNEGILNKIINYFNI